MIKKPKNGDVWVIQLVNRSQALVEILAEQMCLVLDMSECQDVMDASNALDIMPHNGWHYDERDLLKLVERKAHRYNCPLRRR